VKADAGDADAQYNLGVWSRFGLGVPQDSAQGAAWIRKSAQQGHIGAQFNLGLMYSNGHGVPQDYVEAHQWHNLAASRASVEEVTQYAEAPDALAKVMTPAQIADAQTLAQEWQAALDARRE
jgi:TPR repeat protein